MPAATLFSILESPGHPNFSGRYQRLGLQESRFGSMRNALQAIKTQQPDFIVAEFFYGYGNNYAGVNKGGVISPVLSNLYLNEVDRMLERAKAVTRLREEFAKLHVQINEEKSRTVDLTRGESFGFLGFDFRRVRSLSGKWRPQYTPKLKKRMALLQKLREVFRRYQSRPGKGLVEFINPILRGWVNYFAIGHSSRCFKFVQCWVEKQVRRHLMRARNCQGFGWERWSMQWLHDTLGLFNGYQVRLELRKALSSG